ncbi:hypothetical protein DVR12_19310 [Chitinophaga silvatica]|uniref:Uncharacterized protein n=1 Tax=Chitinophaga silvatica TaxID=2282649 RepID=A0A3E1Y744_9BACT|nr:hypothetical protein [Chitinophaga silvatica]RFS20708.1 hypothetical protein DVR12_19310 [Chitinophaga silvatica]
MPLLFSRFRKEVKALFSFLLKERHAIMLDELNDSKNNNWEPDRNLDVFLRFHARIKTENEKAEFKKNLVEGYTLLLALASHPWEKEDILKKPPVENTDKKIDNEE